MDGSIPVRLNIVNDTVTMNWAQAQAWGDYIDYKYSNSNFPGPFGLNSTNAERDNKIPGCSNYREFFWKYFWIIRNKLGTPATGIQIDCPPDGCPSQNPTYYAKLAEHKSTQLNGVRFGPHNEWAMKFQVRCFRDYKAYNDKLMDDMFDMAEANDCYIVYTMGGGSGEAECAGLFGTGDIFTVSSDAGSAYKGFVKYCYDFINAYGNRDSLAMFDVHNEPNTDNMLYGYATRSSGSWPTASCSSTSAPYVITFSTGTVSDGVLPSVGEIFAVFSGSAIPLSYRVTSVTRNVNNYITQIISNVAPLTGTHIQFSNQAYSRWNGWWVMRYPQFTRNAITYYLGSAADQSYMNWAEHLLADIKAGITIIPKPLLTIGNGSSQGDIPGLDVLNGHPYGGAEDNGQNRWTNAAITAQTLGKPLFWEEYGYNRTNHAPWQSYWAFFDMMCAHEGASAGAMQLNGSFHTPDWDYAYDEMQYPGFTPHNGSEDGYCTASCYLTTSEINAFFSGIPVVPTTLLSMTGTGSATHLIIGTQSVRLNGVNDTMVLANAALYHMNPSSNSDVHGTNYVFPTNKDSTVINTGTFMGTGSSILITATLSYPAYPNQFKVYSGTTYYINIWSSLHPVIPKIVKSNYNSAYPIGTEVYYGGNNPYYTDREFWNVYFWLLKSNGFNSIRLNDGDYWGTTQLYNWWSSNRTQYMQYMQDMFDMAAYHGIYVVFCFIGGFYSGAPISPTTTNHVFVPGSTTYNNIVSWMRDMMTTFQSHQGVGMWDLINEPETYYVYSSGTPIIYGGGAQYFMDLTHTGTTAGTTYDVSGGQARIKNYLTILTATALAIDHSHLITIGQGGGAPLSGYDTMPLIAPLNADVWQTHPYYSAYTDANNKVYSWVITTPRANAFANNKINLVGEVGYNHSGGDVPYSYWADIGTDILVPGTSPHTTYGDNVEWMVFNGMSGSPPVPQNPAPGYPVPPSIFYSAPLLANRNILLKSSDSKFKQKPQITKPVLARFKKLGATTTKVSSTRMKNAGIKQTKTSINRFKKTFLFLTKPSSSRMKGRGTILVSSISRFRKSASFAKISMSRFKSRPYIQKTSSSRNKVAGKQITTLSNYRFKKADNQVSKNSISRFRYFNTLFVNSDNTFKKPGNQYTKPSSAFFISIISRLLNKNANSRFKKPGNQISKTSNTKFTARVPHTILETSISRYKKLANQITKSSTERMRIPGKTIIVPSDYKFKTPGVQIAKSSLSRYKVTGRYLSLLSISRFKGASKALTENSISRYKKPGNQVTKVSNYKFKVLGKQLQKTSATRYKKSGASISKNTISRFKVRVPLTKTSSTTFLKATAKVISKNSSTRMKKAGNVKTKTSINRFKAMGNQKTKLSDTRYTSRVQHSINKTANSRFKKKSAYALSANAVFYTFTATVVVPTTASAGQTVTLSATVKGASPFTYQWDFGDGVTQDGTASGSPAYISTTYAYEIGGSYPVSLEAVDNYGRSVESNIATIEVSGEVPTDTDVVFRWSPPADDGSSIGGKASVFGYSIIHGTSLDTLVTATVASTITSYQPTYKLNVGDSAYFKVAAITDYTNGVLGQYAGGIYTDLQQVRFLTLKEVVKMRGVALSPGYVDFYFTARTEDGSYIQYTDSDGNAAFWRLTDHGTAISAGYTIDNIKLLVEHPEQNIYINGITGTGISPSNWPINIIGGVSATKTTDILGDALNITFTLTSSTSPATTVSYIWDVHAVTVAPENATNEIGLDGMSAFMIITDYTTDISFFTENSTRVNPGVDVLTGTTGSLIWTINAAIVYSPYKSNTENVPQVSKQFYIPIYELDTLDTIKKRIDSGNQPGESIPCFSLGTQINNYFTGSDGELNSYIVDLYTETDPKTPFTVITDITTGTSDTDGKRHLKVNIRTMVERVQNQVTCRTSNLNCFYLATNANCYFVADRTMELRSFEDMYGRNKPGSTLVTGYTKRSYGFRFNLDYIKSYVEEESSTLDVTPIPGTSSSNAIGLDIMGPTRVINISGIRVDNSNDWFFHAPYEFIDDKSSGGNILPPGQTGQIMQGGVIYAGTSNWGWCKFMKAVMGTFQFIDGPYRLIMMTVPSSLMQQYVPSRYCKYQYPDGTYIVQAGLEDMCYVMIERFNTTMTEEMFNAIQYELILKRVMALGSSV